MTDAPVSRPTRIDVRATGEASSRSKNPVWMSVAVSLPALRPPKSTDCVIDAGSRNCSSESTPSKPGRKSIALPIVERVHRRDEHREQQPGQPHRRLAERAPDRPAGQARGLGQRLARADARPRRATAVDGGRGHATASGASARAGALEPAAGGVGEHVVEARGVELDVLHRDAGVLEGAQRAGQRGRAAVDADGDGARSWRPGGSPNRAEHLGGPRLVRRRRR